MKVYRKAALNKLNELQVQREVYIHSKLNHKYAVKLYAAFEDDENVYLVQQYAERGDLFFKLKQSGTLYTDERYLVQQVIYPLLSVLSTLHARGIIHR